MEIWHEEAARSVRERLDGSVLSLEDTVSLPHIRSTQEQLALWPILEALYLSRQSLKRYLSAEEKRKLAILEETIEEYESQGYPALFRDRPREFSFKIIKPGDVDYFREALGEIPTCIKPQKIDAKVRKFMEDIELGGTIVYFLEQDGKPVVYNRLFTFVSKDGKTGLFYDTIENGNHKTNSMAHWEDQGRVPELLLSTAFAAHLSHELATSYLVLADRELDELGGIMGAGRSLILPRSKRKAGLPVNPRNKGDVVYQSRMYKVADGGYRTVEMNRRRLMSTLFEDFMTTYAGVESKEFNPRIKRFRERARHTLFLGRALAGAEKLDSRIKGIVSKRVGYLSSALA